MGFYAPTLGTVNEGLIFNLPSQLPPMDLVLFLVVVMSWTINGAMGWPLHPARHPISRMDLCCLGNQYKFGPKTDINNSIAAEPTNATNMGFAFGADLMLCNIARHLMASPLGTTTPPCLRLRWGEQLFQRPKTAPGMQAVLQSSMAWRFYSALSAQTITKLYLAGAGLY